MSHELHFKLKEEPKKPYKDCDIKSETIKYFIFHALQEYKVDNIYVFIRDFNTRINALKYMSRNNLDEYVYNRYQEGKDVYFVGWEYSGSDYEDKAQNMLNCATDIENELYMRILKYKPDDEISDFIFELNRLCDEYMDDMYEYFTYKWCSEHRDEIVKDEEE